MMKGSDLWPDESRSRGNGLTDRTGRHVKNPGGKELSLCVSRAFLKCFAVLLTHSIDRITAIFISALLDQNLGIIAACIPTFQPLFRSFAKTIRSVGNNKDRSLGSSYRMIPDKGGKTRNIDFDRHASQSAPHSRTSTITTAFASRTLTDAADLGSDFALHGLKPIGEDGGITYKKTFDVKYGAQGDL